MSCHSECRIWLMNGYSYSQLYFDSFAKAVREVVWRSNSWTVRYLSASPTLIPPGPRWFIHFVREVIPREYMESSVSSCTEYSKNTIEDKRMSNTAWDCLVSSWMSHDLLCNPSPPKKDRRGIRAMPVSDLLFFCRPETREKIRKQNKPGRSCMIRSTRARKEPLPGCCRYWESGWGRPQCYVIL